MAAYPVLVQNYKYQTEKNSELSDGPLERPETFMDAVRLQPGENTFGSATNHSTFDNSPRTLLSKRVCSSAILHNTAS
ncbi:hypothetical protein T09_3430 [Trichinella sp. T9]|nr:hypothetical protein T09_3430 [Trichinella sp. T9]